MWSQHGIYVFTNGISVVTTQCFYYNNTLLKQQTWGIYMVTTHYITNRCRVFIWSEHITETIDSLYWIRVFDQIVFNCNLIYVIVEGCRCTPACLKSMMDNLNGFMSDMHKLALVRSSFLHYVNVPDVAHNFKWVKSLLTAYKVESRSFLFGKTLIHSAARNYQWSQGCSTRGNS